MLSAIVGMKQTLCFNYGIRSLIGLTKMHVIVKTMPYRNNLDSFLKELLAVFHSAWRVEANRDKVWPILESRIWILKHKAIISWA